MAKRLCSLVECYWIPSICSYIAVRSLLKRVTTAGFTSPDSSTLSIRSEIRSSGPFISTKLADLCLSCASLSNSESLRFACSFNPCSISTTSSYNCVWSCFSGLCLTSSGEVRHTGPVNDQNRNPDLTDSV